MYILCALHLNILLIRKPDIHHVDVEKYADTPISTVKNLLNYWFDKAAWHKPSIIVLDNLDKLLSAEVEVSLMFLFFLLPH